ncbi:MAG: hypothetical protein AAGG02_15495 [Cyanobacteria bacterium P01_H01_bin.15]
MSRLRVLSLSILCAGMGLAQPAFSAPFPNEYVQTYLDQCGKTATAEGLPGELAQELCGCTLNEFQARYTVTEFQSLRIKAEATPPDTAAQTTLSKVGETCFNKLVFVEE